MRPLLLLPLVALALAAPARAQPVPAGSHQLVVVTTAGWGATTGALRRYERAGPRAAWRAVGAAVPVVVGRTGLAWGDGLHGGALGPGPVKAEGDGRAPAGAFRLTEAFGYAPAGATNAGLPYRQATPDLECVDDPASAHYNDVLDRATVAAPDWASHEELLRPDSLYRLGVVVGHNPAGRPRGGSCIFLHLWSGPASTTAGCTAMDGAPLTALLGWLRADAAPVLVQLPAAEYRARRRAWALPAL